MTYALIGYLAAVLMGGTLGLLGGGGSVLTLPILVYLFAVEPMQATTYSLAVVGITAFAGCLRYLQRGLIDGRAMLIFGLPALAGVLLSRLLIVPNLPETIWQSGSFTVTRDLLIMLIFAVILLLAAGSMIIGRRETESPADPTASTLPGVRGVVIAGLQGIGVGCLTGLVGAGGGFLIVPALVVLLKMPMRHAIGTSLMIIAVNSLLGFAGDWLMGRAIDPRFLLTFAGLAILGMLVGVWLNERVAVATLKPLFGWFVLLVGIFVLLQELWL